jgi:hypothetical protein
LSASVGYRVNHPRVISQVIDNEVIIIDVTTGSYYSLLGSAVPLWESVQATASLSDIIARWTGRYQGNPDLIVSEASDFIERLLKEQLIATVDEGPDRPSGGNPPAREDQKVPFEAPILERYDDMQDLILLDPVHEVDDSQGWPRMGSNLG